MRAPADRVSGSGFTVLDGVSLVAGAAVAAVHVRDVLRDDPAGPGWVLMLGTFVWVALTSAGPFLFLVRKYVRGLPVYPKVGDRLWALLGLPWLATAVLLSTLGVAGMPAGGVVETGLVAGLAVASSITLVVVWTTWVVVTPGDAAKTFSPPWTNRVGLILAVAWPVQCAAGMVVIG